MQVFESKIHVALTRGGPASELEMLHRRHVHEKAEQERAY